MDRCDAFGRTCGTMGVAGGRGRMARIQLVDLPGTAVGSALYWAESPARAKRYAERMKR